MSNDLKASGVQLPIFLFVAGGVLLVSAFKGQGLIDVLAGVPGNTLDPKGGKSKSTASTPTATTTGGSGGGGVSNAKPGSPVPGQSPHASTHPTAGLPGFPAYDYMAPAGTPCVAPASGIIVRISGKDPKLGGKPGGALGYSIYLKSADKTYFMTHLDKVSVKGGQKVAQGQQIAEVANGPASWSSPHVHMGVSNV